MIVKTIYNSFKKQQQANMISHTKGLKDLLHSISRDYPVARALYFLLEQVYFLIY